MWLPKFLRKTKTPEVEVEKEICCEKCGTTEFPNGRYGEEIRGKWHYWCANCYFKRFIVMMNSNPQALAKYHNIYGKSPEEVLSEKMYK